MKQFTIYYMKPEHFRDGICGLNVPTVSSLNDTHTQLRVVKAEGLEDAFYLSQGEIWSPNGEARELIRSKGLQHTSMSVGDVIMDEDGQYHVVAMFGFKPLEA